MKKTNKGFSMVELIIVIAIMAILAGALAPALIKYINKSRISTDIQTGQTIATAIQTALSNETGYDCAVALGTGSIEFTNDYYDSSQRDVFKKSVASTVGGTKAPTIKSKKCVAKTSKSTTNTNKHFFFKVDPAKNEVFVYIGGDHQVYPTADKCLTDDEETNCAH